MADTKPLISIITVVFNGEKYLEETVLSVLNQTYDNVEYIIIDGGSTDGTVDIIKKYEDKIDYWVSERDGGIYDAMNKGIDIATGKWINFMNVGDSFFDDNILDIVFAKNKFENIDVIYGNHKVIYPNKTRIAKAGDIRDIWRGSQFCHQSSFISSTLHKSKRYNICNRIGADFEFFYTAYKNGAKFGYIDVVMANYAAGGVSDVKRVESIVERWNVIDKSIKTNFYYIWLIIKEMLKHQIKKIIKNI
jgi:glycosyltransferase involved in cell wall biosynthesis